MIEIFELKTILNDILLCKCTITYLKVLQNNKKNNKQQRTNTKSHTVIIR
jgi:hypothetical protein